MSHSFSFVPVRTTGSCDLEGTPKNRLQSFLVTMTATETNQFVLYIWLNWTIRPSSQCCDIMFWPQEGRIDCNSWQKKSTSVLQGCAEVISAFERFRNRSSLDSSYIRINYCLDVSRESSLKDYVIINDRSFYSMDTLLYHRSESHIRSLMIKCCKIHLPVHSVH